MTRRGLSWLIGGGVALVALVLVLTAVPMVSDARSKDGSATAVAIGDPVAHDPELHCLDVAFEAVISYTSVRPILDLWGFAHAQDVVVDPARLEVAAKPECAEEFGSVEATGYLNAPLCESGLCEGAYLEYRTGVGESGTTSLMNFHGPQTLPGSGVVRNEWCLGFGAQVGYGRGNGTGESTSTRLTDSDLCLDLS
jgi:hypothetical protein